MSDQRRRPPVLNALERLGLDQDDEQRPPETPPYRANMSQLTLPPEYLSDHGARDDDDDDNDGRRPRAFASSSNEKRRADDDEDDDDDTRARTRPQQPPELRVQTSDDNDNGGRPVLTPAEQDSASSGDSASRSHARFVRERERHQRDDEADVSGDTLVNNSRRERGGERGEKDGRAFGVHYPDEHGGLLHTVPSPDYPDLRGRSEGGVPRPRPRRSSVSVESSRSRAPSLADTDNDDEADELYDWSDEDDLVDQEAHFEAKLNAPTMKKKTWGIRRIATFFVSTLIGTTLLVCALVAVPITLRYTYYLPHPTHKRDTITRNVSAWFYWAAANLLISWYLAVIVNVIPHIATWIVSVAWGTITESFKTKISLFEAFKGWIKPVLYAASAWVSWVIIFANIYGLHNTATEVTSNAAYTDRLYEVIELLFFFVLVVCIEKILLQFIAFTFHRAAYQDRLDEVNKALAVFDRLKDYRPKRTYGHSHTPSRLAGMMSANGRQTPPMGFGRTGTGFGDFYMGSRPGTPDINQQSKLEEGFAADSEDYFGDEKTKRKSWLFSGKGTAKNNVNANGRGGHGLRAGSDDSNGGGHTHENMPMSPRTHVPGDSTGSAGPSRTGSQDLDGVTNNKRGPRFANAQQHTYPPTSGRGSPDLGKASVDGSAEDGAVLANAAKALKTAILHDARNIKGKDTTEADVSFTITSPHEAKKLARNLYMAFRADRKRSYLIPSDFYPAYPKKEDAKEAFRIFDKDDNENITRAEIKTTIMKVYKERRFLARSLRDVGAALKTLDIIMLMAMMVVLFFIALSVFNVNFTKSLTSVYTLGIAASFVFKNAAANAFDAIMFIFVTHPYDTGDRCFIDGENLVVRKMGLFATLFTRSDGTSTYYFNSQLTAKFIINARRSGKTAENLTMQVDWRTPLEKLDALDKALNHWIDTDENRWYSGSTNCTLQHIDYQRSLEITIGIPHNSNWQDWGAALNRKTAFHAAVNHYCREIGIVWANSPQPILLTSHAAHQPPTAEDLLDYADEDEPVSPGPASPGGVSMAPVQPALFFTPPKDDKPTGLRKRRKNNAGGANF